MSTESNNHPITETTTLVSIALIDNHDLESKFDHATFVYGIYLKNELPILPQILRMFEEVKDTTKVQPFTLNLFFNAMYINQVDTVAELRLTPNSLIKAIPNKPDQNFIDHFLSCGYYPDAFYQQGGIASAKENTRHGMKTLWNGTSKII